MTNAVVSTQHQARNAVINADESDWENQDFWKRGMSTHGKSLRDGDLSYAKRRHVAAACDALVQVGLMKSRENFRQISSCLSADIRNNIPPYRITRIVVDRAGKEEQLLIQGLNGELVLLNKCTDGWELEGKYKWRPTGEIHWKTVKNPSFLLMYQEYERILSMVQELEETETAAKEVLLAVLPAGVSAIILSYDGYARERDKASAETHRKELMASLPVPVSRYQLPAP